MKKGYFFMLDAFLAMSIIVMSLLLIFSFHGSEPYQMQGIFLSDDVLDVLSTTKVEEINNRFIIGLINNTNITNPGNTLIEQTAEFYIRNESLLAEQFVETIAGTVVPGKYGCILYIRNSTHSYNITINPSETAEQDARLIVTSKRLVSGIYNGLYWGPMTAEVRLWQ